MDSRKFSDRTGHLWVIVPGARDDRYLRSATASPAELFVPSQFRLQHQSRISPLQGALRRATALVPRQRILAVVAEEHRQWWQHPLWFLSASNVLVQPKKLALAHGLVAALLKIHERDSAARVILLPSTHQVRDEAVLAQSLRDAALRITERRSALLLLGVEPEGHALNHPIIVTGQRHGANEFDLVRLIQNPGDRLSADSREHRLLWNTSIIAGSTAALLAAFERRWPRDVDEMRTAVRRDPQDRTIHPVAGGFGGRSFDPVLPQLLLAAKQEFRVLRVPLCGWGDVSIVEHAREIPSSSQVPPLLTGPMPVERRWPAATQRADGS